MFLPAVPPYKRSNKKYLECLQLLQILKGVTEIVQDALMKQAIDHAVKHIKGILSFFTGV